MFKLHSYFFLDYTLLPSTEGENNEINIFYNIKVKIV